MTLFLPFTIVVTTRANKDPRKVRKALERLKFHSKLIKRCHNQC